MKIDFGKIITAMVTPFDQSYKLDKEAIRGLVKHLEETGTNTIVLAGTTGEGPTISEEEKLVLLEEVYSSKSADTKIIMNVGTNNTMETVENAVKWSRNEKVDGIMVVCPYYNKPNQNGLYRHFEEVNNSVEKPIMAYHIPGRTNVTMTAETMVKIAKLNNVLMLKDAEGNLDKLKYVIEETKGLWDVYSGDDPALLEYLKIGSKGIVSVASHIIGDSINILIEAFENGAEQSAQELQQYIKSTSEQLFPSFSPNPVPIKFVLNNMGLIKEEVRLPLVKLESEERQIITKELIELQVM